MTLQDVKEVVFNSPNFRNLEQRIREAATNGTASVLYPPDKMNKTLIEYLEKGEFVVELDEQQNRYVISGW